MRRIELSATALAADTDGFKDDATGAGPFAMTATTTTDGLAHKVTLTSTANLSAINMTITGTDPDGRAITEVIAGPNNTTVTSTAYFLTVTRVSAAATLGANVMDVGWSAIAVTKSVPMDINIGFQASIGLVISGTTNVTVQHTFDDLNTTTSPTWFNHASLAAKTASEDGNYAFPCTAVRLLINSGAGTTRFIVLQAGYC